MQQDHSKPINSVAGTSASAQTNAESTGFVKVEGGKEQTSAEGTLILAYMLIWAIMIFFLSRILRGQREMVALTQRVVKAVGGNTNDRK